MTGFDFAMLGRRASFRDSDDVSARREPFILAGVCIYFRRSRRRRALDDAGGLNEWASSTLLQRRIRTHGEVTQTSISLCRALRRCCRPLLRDFSARTDDLSYHAHATVSSPSRFRSRFFPCFAREDFSRLRHYELYLRYRGSLRESTLEN